MDSAPGRWVRRRSDRCGNQGQPRTDRDVRSGRHRAGAFGFVLWLAKLDIDREFQSYHIYFEGSVSGLSLGSDVLYRDIPVGTVTEILIDPEDPGRVLVAVDLASTTPIRQDSIATLEVQGITGVSLIQIGGGGHDSPVLQAEPGAAFPVITFGARELCSTPRRGARTGHAASNVDQ